MPEREELSLMHYTEFESLRTKPKLPLYAEDRCCSGCGFALVQTQQELEKGLEGWRWRDGHQDGMKEWGWEELYEDTLVGS